MLAYIVLFASIAQPGVIFPQLEHLRVFLLAVVLLLLVFLFSGLNTPSNKVGLKHSKYIYAMVVVYTLSEAQHFWFSGTIEVFMFWFKKALTFFLVVNIIRTAEDLKKSIWSVTLAVVFLTYIGWKMYLYTPHLLENAGRFQSIGNYNLSNSYALLATLSWPLAFFLMEAEKGFFKKLLLAAFLAAIFISGLYTKSRGGMLGMTAGVVLSILMSRRVFGNKVFKMAGAGGVIAAVAVYGFALILSRQDISGITGGDTSSGDRLMAWVAAFRMFIDKPVLGIGWGHFMDEAYNYGMDKKLLAHNTLLSVLAETGVAGISLFVIIIYQTFTQLYRVRKDIDGVKEASDLYSLSTGIYISFICFLINSSFSVKDHDPMYWMILYLAGAAIAIHNKNIPEQKEEKTCKTPIRTLKASSRF